MSSEVRKDSDDGSSSDTSDGDVVAPETETSDVGSWYDGSMPHAPPATDGPNEDTIWFELIEDSQWAQEIAWQMNYQDADRMDTVAVIIRDDWREFYIPLNSTWNVFEDNVEMLKDHHLSDAREYNDEITYDHTVKDLDIGGTVERNEESDSKVVDWDNIMDEDEDEKEDIDTNSLDDDLDEAFSDM